MQRDKVQRLLGLAARAGGVAFGEGAAYDPAEDGDAP